MKIFFQKYIFVMTLYLIAALIYVVYRTNMTFVNQVLVKVFDYEEFIRSTRKIRTILNLPAFFVYNLPSGIWLFATVFFTRKMQLPKIAKRYFLLAPLVITLIIELLQYLRLTNGFFDSIDILTAVSFFILSLVFPKNKIVIKKNYIALTLLYLMIYFSNV